MNGMNGNIIGEKTHNQLQVITPHNLSIMKIIAKSSGSSGIVKFNFIIFSILH